MTTTDRTHPTAARAGADPALADLGRNVAAAQDEALRSADWVQLARQRLFAAPRVPARRRPRRSWLFAATVVGPAAAAVAVALWVLVIRGSASPIGYAVGASSAVERAGRWIVAPADAPLPLRFTEGSVVTLQPASSARVEALTARSSTVVLERGRIDVSVVHRAGTDWRARAGPFEIRVTGTRFAVDWEPTQKRFGVTLYEGAVEVVGGDLGPDGQHLAAGQRLEVVLGTGSWAIAPANASSVAPGGERVPSAETQAPAAALPPPAVQSPGPSTAIAAAAPSRRPRSIEDKRGASPTAAALTPIAPLPQPAATPDWQQLYRSGSFSEAWDLVAAAGFDVRCSDSSAGELLNLADLARLAGHSVSATRAWLEIRTRFPDTPEAASAAFALGRSAFDELHTFHEAAVWFSICRAEQPNGPLAREAAGRLIEARLRAGELDEAQAAARQYLAVYPHGPHATMARRVLEPAGAP